MALMTLDIHFKFVVLYCVCTSMCMYVFDCIVCLPLTLDSRPKGRGFEPHRRHCVVSLSKNINPSLVLVLPRKTRPFITERLLMGRKESNQTNKHPYIETVPHFLRKQLFSLGQKSGYIS